MPLEKKYGCDILSIGSRVPKQVSRKMNPPQEVVILVGGSRTFGGVLTLG